MTVLKLSVHVSRKDPKAGISPSWATAHCRSCGSDAMSGDLITAARRSKINDPNVTNADVPVTAVTQQASPQPTATSCLPQ